MQGIPPPHLQALSQDAVLSVLVCAASSPQPLQQLHVPAGLLMAAAAEGRADPRLTVHWPSRAVPAGQRVSVVVSLQQQGRFGAREAVLCQLPVLVLPAAAAGELRKLHADMALAAGSSAAAYLSFAALAGDMAAAAAVPQLLTPGSHLAGLPGFLCCHGCPAAAALLRESCRACGAAPTSGSS